MKENYDLTAILKNNIKLFGTNPSVTIVEDGFTNQIFDVNNKYIVKICNNTYNEQKFKNEISFYELNKTNPSISKLIKYSINKEDNHRYYAIYNKEFGKPLYYIWHDLSVKEREKTIKEIVSILRGFHIHQKQGFDYGKYMSNLLDGYLVKFSKYKVFSSKEKKILRKSFNTFSYFLRSDKLVLIHNELHFGNILYYNNKIKIIDFEKSVYAPLDKELDVFLRMCDHPLEYATLDAKKYVHPEEFFEVKQLMKTYYPEMFDVINFKERLLIYDMRDALELLMRNLKDKNIKKIIINNAKELIDTYSK